MSTRLTRRPFRLALFAAALAVTPAVVAAQHTARGPNIPQVARTAGQTDEAFKRLPAGTVTDLLKPENREKLVTLLTYHVVPGRVTAAQARTLSSAQTVAGQKVTVRDVDGELRINNAVVRIADVARMVTTPDD